MDVGLPRRTHDVPDPINKLYALWVRDALEVAYDHVRRHADQAVRRQKQLNDKRAAKTCVCCRGLDFEVLPPAKKCKLDSPWLGPYLVVSLAGWAVGVQLHPDSPVLMIHCQDLKNPRLRGLVSWICTDSPASSPTPPVLGACTVCRSLHSIGFPTTAISYPDSDFCTTYSGLEAEWSGGFHAGLDILTPKLGHSHSPTRVESH